MPRAVDRYPQNLQLTHDPTKQLSSDVQTKGAVEKTAGTIGVFQTMIQEGLAGVAGAFSAFIGKLHAEIAEAVAGVQNGDASDLNAWALNMRHGVQTTINSIVNAWFGWTGAWDPSDAADALQNQASAIAGLSASVTALQSSQNNQAVGGRSAMVDLTIRAPGSTFGADFLHIRSGGAGHYGIGAGGEWQEVNDSDAVDAFTYLDLETSTDYQKVWMIFGSAPMWTSGSNKARNEIHGRKNAAGDTYVFAGVEKKLCDIGCVVAGARTVFTTRSSGFSFKVNTPYALETGTIAGIRVFRLSEGFIPVLGHTEVGTTSQAGASYRRAGGSGAAKASWLGTTAPGTVLALAVGDNYPPAVVGSGAEMLRTSTATYALSSGVNQLPPGFFDSVGPLTEDIGRDLTNGTFTVSRRGWYRVTARVPMVDTLLFPKHVNLVLFKGSGGSPAAERYMGPGAGSYQDPLGTYPPSGVYGSVDVYLDAGDFVALGYDSAAATGQFTGDAAGTQAFFTITATGTRGLG